MAGLLILTGVSCFALGRISSYDAASHAGVQLEQFAAQDAQNIPVVAPSVATTPQDANAQSAGALTGQPQGMYVGSKNGTVYHLPWCPGAARIKDENKVWFSSKAEAEAAGYAPAANCKGI